MAQPGSSCRGNGMIFSVNEVNTIVVSIRTSPKRSQTSRNSLYSGMPM